MADIFQNTDKIIPKRDAQIVRVGMTEADIGARRDHMPATDKSGDMSIRHVPNAGTNG